MEFEVGQKVRSPNGTEGVVSKIFKETPPEGDLLVTFVDEKGEKRSRIVHPQEVRPA